MIRSFAGARVFGLVIGSCWFSGNSSAQEPPSTPPAFDQSFTTRDVSFLDDAARLHGTLYLPGREDESPGVVLLTGSGRGPRNPLMNKLARHFATEGVAAFTYDSPGTGVSTGTAMLQTKQDRAREALRAVRFLRAQKEILAAEVGIWGGSEGAGVALLAAADDAELAFVIPVSGSVGVSPMEVTRYRIEMMGLERGVAAENVQRALVFAELMYALLTGLDLVEWRLLEAKVRRWPGEPWNQLIDLTLQCQRKQRRGHSSKQRAKIWSSLQGVLRSWTSEPWFSLVASNRRQLEQFLTLTPEQFTSFLERGPLAAGDWDFDHHQQVAIPRIQCPVLAIWGSQDSYTPVHHSAAELGESLAGAKTQDVTLLIVPGASHFLTVSGPDDPFAGDYLEVMTEWLRERFGRPPRNGST